MGSGMKGAWVAIILLGAALAAVVAAGVFWSIGHGRPPGERIGSTLGAAGVTFATAATLGLLVLSFLLP